MVFIQTKIIASGVFFDTDFIHTSFQFFPGYFNCRFRKKPCLQIFVKPDKRLMKGFAKPIDIDMKTRMGITSQFIGIFNNHIVN